MIKEYLDPFRPYFSALKWGLVVLLFLGTFVGGCSHGENNKQGEMDKYKARVVEATNRAAEKARKVEGLQRIAFDEIGKTYYQKGTIDAKSKQDATIAGLRAGTIRLRSHWRSCESNASGSASEFARGAELREADIGRLRAIGAKADAQVVGLQDALEVERRDD